MTVDMASMSDQLFLDLNICFTLDVHQDPVYPYTPPSFVERLGELIARPAGAFKTVILCTSHSTCSTAEIENIEALARFFASPACEEVSALRICGPLRVLNNRTLQDSFKQMHVQTLIIQETQALLDSYSLSGLLSSLEGITSLHLPVTAQDSIEIHTSFNEETRQSMSKLQRLHLCLQGNVAETLVSLFSPDTMPNIVAMEIIFEGTHWTQTSTNALMSAASGFPHLSHLSFSRSPMDAHTIFACDSFTALAPLLQLPTLEEVSLVAFNPTENIKLSKQDLMDIPSTLKRLSLVHAGLPDPVDTYGVLSQKLPEFTQLTSVTLAHLYPETAKSGDNVDGWEVVGRSAGHPNAAPSDASSALLRFANELGAANVSYRLKLLGPTNHEERVHLVR
jgi:hypothetical protein